MANALTWARRCIGIGTISAALIVGGCGGGFDGFELNGKIFDALGVSGDTFGKRSEPKTQARAPLVVPPDSSRLPEPGSQPTAGAPITTGAVDSSWPRDRDAIKAADTDAQQKAKAQYCKDQGWKDRATKQDTGADPCSGSIFSVMGNSIFGNSEK